MVRAVMSLYEGAKTRVRVGLELSEEFEVKVGALTIWMEFSEIPERIQMERFIPVECFRKKGNTFRGIPFFSLWPECPEISVPFVHDLSTITSARENRPFHLFFNRNNPFFWQMIRHIPIFLF